MTTDGQAYFDLPQAIQGLKGSITLYQEGSPKFVKLGVE